MSALESVLVAIGGNAALLAVLSFLAKSVIEKVLARESKQFETELKAKADSTMERLKNDLQLRTIEHQVRFSKLHEKRAEVIAELYSKLRTALWNSESFLAPVQWAGDPNPKEKHLTAMNSLVEAYRYFGEHRIYLPEELCDSLEKLIRDTRAEVIRLGVWIDHDERSLPSHAQNQKHESWMAAWSAITTDIPKATHALEEEFRALLGGQANVSGDTGAK